MKYLLLIIFIILGTIAYYFTEGTSSFWYVGTFYGQGICAILLYILDNN